MAERAGVTAQRNHLLLDDGDGEGVWKEATVPE